MKVLHLSRADIRGGAHRSAYRLHAGLNKIGIDSKMLVANKLSNDPKVYESKGKIDKVWNKAYSFVDRILLSPYDLKEIPFHLAWVSKGNIANQKLVKDADIINLHWIVGGFLSIKDIWELAKLDKPVVWTLHDMWAFTGGCHYSGECEKYIDSCGACPQLKSNKREDITNKTWKRKERVYKALNLTIVTPSKWLAGCAKKSSLFSNLDIKVIPYGLDLAIFKPIDKLKARNILDLSENKNIILFGAVRLEKRKGFNYLKEAIRELDNMAVLKKEKMCLVIFGASYSQNIQEFPFEVRFLGRLNDSSLTLSYSAADVFVASSLQDNLPNTVMEALSCGTPVVGFKVGGIPEMIEHRVNGYLAEYRDPKSLAEGIKWILEDEERAFKLRKASREKALKEYSLRTQAERYSNLYESLLNVGAKA